MFFKGSRMVSLVSYLQVMGLGFMNLVWMNVKEYLVMGLWVYFLDLLVWFIEVSMLNALEFFVLRLIMNVGRLGLSWFGEEHEVHLLGKKKNNVLPKKLKKKNIKFLKNNLFHYLFFNFLRWLFLFIKMLTWMLTWYF